MMKPVYLTQYKVGTFKWNKWLTDEDGQKKRARKARLSKSASFIEQNKETMYLEELGHLPPFGSDVCLF